MKSECLMLTIAAIILLGCLGASQLAYCLIASKVYAYIGLFGLNAIGVLFFVLTVVIVVKTRKKRSS